MIVVYMGIPFVFERDTANSTFAVLSNYTGSLFLASKSVTIHHVILMSIRPCMLAILFPPIGHVRFFSGPAFWRISHPFHAI